MFTPLVYIDCSVIDDALLRAMRAIPKCRFVHVMNFSKTDPLLNFFANFVVHWVYRSGCWIHSPDKINVGVSHFRGLEDKELTTDLAHDRKMLFIQKHIMVICQIIWIRLHSVKNKFQRKFLSRKEIWRIPVNIHAMGLLKLSIILSVCPSVRLSVCLFVRPSVCLSLACFVTNLKNIVTANVLIPHDRVITVVFWYQQRFVGDVSFHLKFALKVTLPFKKRRLRQISAYNL